MAFYLWQSPTVRRRSKDAEQNNFHDAGWILKRAGAALIYPARVARADARQPEVIDVVAHNTNGFSPARTGRTTFDTLGKAANCRR